MIPTLSIIIPCKNEAGNIGMLFESILIQEKINVNSIPIIVADAGSSDDTLSVIEIYKNKHHLPIEVVQGGYPAIGRNNGARHAQSDYLIFIDADITLGEPLFLHNVISKILEKHPDLVTSYIKCYQGNWFDNLFWKIHSLFLGLSTYFKPLTAGMFICIKRKTFWSLGGFDEEIILGEDVELSYKIDRKKFSIAKTFVYTTNRRFKKMGYINTIIYYTLVAFSSRFRHRNNAFYFEDKNKTFQRRESLEKLQNGLKSIFNK